MKNPNFMKAPLPEGRPSQKMTKVEWQGLNKTQTLDTGQLSAESNISTDAAPYLIPSKKRTAVGTLITGAFDLFGFGDFLIVLYKTETDVKMRYIKGDKTYEGVLTSTGQSNFNTDPRTIVQFNVYSDPKDPIDGTYTKKLLIFPDKKSMDFDISADFTPAAITGMPDIKYATVHLSRLFGVDDGRVYASGAGDYANWINDDMGEDGHNPDNAWVSTVGGNTKSGGNLTGITSYAGHVICFKDDFMHELYNNKNPFRVQDIYAEGCMNNRSIQEVDGRLFFVDKDAVKLYTGANPRVISQNLNVTSFSKAVAGSDGRKYYLYCETNSEKKMFVFDTLVGQWAEEKITFEIHSFAKNSTGLYALGAPGLIYKIDTDGYDHDWYFETDLFTGQSIDIKRLRKIQILADIDDTEDVTAWFKIYGLYDNETYSGSTSHLIYDSGSSKGMQTIRVIPRQTAGYGFKLRFLGHGRVTIYQMELYFEKGGEKFGQ